MSAHSSPSSTTLYHTMVVAPSADSYPSRTPALSHTLGWILQVVEAHAGPLQLWT